MRNCKCVFTDVVQWTIWTGVEIAGVWKISVLINGGLLLFLLWHLSRGKSDFLSPASSVYLFFFPWLRCDVYIMWSGLRACFSLQLYRRVRTICELPCLHPQRWVSQERTATNVEQNSELHSMIIIIFLFWTPVPYVSHYIFSCKHFCGTSI